MGTIGRETSVANKRIVIASFDDEIPLVTGYNIPNCDSNRNKSMANSLILPKCVSLPDLVARRDWLESGFRSVSMAADFHDFPHNTVIWAVEDTLLNGDCCHSASSSN